jgi:mono/diheme cytochrome c family protein
VNAGARSIIAISGLAALSAVAACGGARTTPAPAVPAAPATAPDRAATVAATVGAAVPAGPSTRDSIYTKDQAARGKDVYLGNCQSCHTPAAHANAVFQGHWKGKQLSDLYMYVLTKMPGNDPGSLSPDAAADVVAYLLQLNAMPAGSQEIYPEADSLKKYRIDLSRK